MGIRKLNRALKKLEEFEISVLLNELAQRLDRASNKLDNLEKKIAQSYETKKAEVKIESFEVVRQEEAKSDLKSIEEVDQEEDFVDNPMVCNQEEIPDLSHGKNDDLNLILSPIDLVDDGDHEESKQVEDEVKEYLINDQIVSAQEVLPSLPKNEINDANWVLDKGCFGFYDCSDFQNNAIYQSPLDKSIDKKLYGGNSQNCLLLESVHVGIDHGGLTNSSKYYVEFVTLVQGGRRGGRHKKRWFRRHKKRRFEKHKQRWLRFVFDPGG